MRSYLWLGLLVASASANSQPLKTTRPKVALALSGGGALGFAELGALEWLEEHRIPVDGIAGTSAGALVGGWYATGIDLLSDDEIAVPLPHRKPSDMVLRGFADVLAAVDFNEVFNGSPSFRESPMDVKEGQRDFPSDVFLGLANGRITSMDGLVEGQRIRTLLDAIAIQYPLTYLQHHSPTGIPFDTLPTPFRCVANDVQGISFADWRTVVLDGRPAFPDVGGYRLGLPDSIRASIAIPIIFSPVYDPPLTSPGDHPRHTLVDGGVIDNYPTDVAIDEFEPDGLIGLRFGVDLSPLNLLMKATGHPTVPQSVEVRSGALKPGRRHGMPSTVVNVNLFTGRFNTQDFSNWRELAWLGYRSMEKAYETRFRAQLDQLSLPLPDYLAFRQARRARRSNAPVIPKTAPGLPNSLLAKDVTEPKVRIDLDRALDRIAAEGVIGTVGYEMEGEGLRLDPTVRSYGPPYIFLRGAVAADSRGPASYRLDSQLWAPKLSNDNMDWRTDLDLGSDLALKSKLEWRSGSLFIGPTVEIASTEQFDYSAGVRTSEVRVSDQRIGLRVGTRPSRASEVSFAADAGHMYSDSNFPAGTYHAVTLMAKADTTNSPTVPTRGLSAALWMQDLFGFPGANRDLPRIASTMDFRVPTDRGDDPLVFRGGFGSSFGNRAPFLTQFRLGGSDQMLGYAQDEIRADAFGFGSIGYLHRLLRIPDYLGKVYLDTRIETAAAAGRSWNDAGLGVIFDTSLCPLYFGAARADGGRMRWTFEFGGPSHRPSQGFEPPIPR